MRIEGSAAGSRRCDPPRSVDLWAAEAAQLAALCHVFRLGTLVKRYHGLCFGEHVQIPVRRRCAMAGGNLSKAPTTVIRVARGRGRASRVLVRRGSGCARSPMRLGGSGHGFNPQLNP
eukprot:1469668-Prymnesium_polylepis.1